MNITEDIKRKRMLEDYNNKIAEIYETAKKTAFEKYKEKECNHDIIVRFYGNFFSYAKKEPDHVCLGCETSFELCPKEKEIIDFTKSDQGTYYKGNRNYLISYLQDLALDFNEKFPTYTDYDFEEMVRCNIDYIKVNKGYPFKKI